MTNTLPKHTRNHREEVLSFLELISNENYIKELLKKMNEENLPRFLFKTWLEEIYLPSTTYEESIKGDVSNQANDVFFKQFNKEEIKALELFNNFFELRLGIIKRSSEKYINFFESDRWNYIVKDAELALDSFEVKEEESELRWKKFLSFLNQRLS